MKEYKIIILDFSKGEVHIHDYDINLYNDDTEWFENSNYNQKDCQWMIVENLNIQIH